MPADRHCALDHDLRRFYAMTCHQYETLFEYQGGVCYVCGKPPVKQRLAVDEDHDTKPVRIRGLAHRHCNRIIETAAKVRHALEDPPGFRLGYVVPEDRTRAAERRRRKRRTAARRRAEAKAADKAKPKTTVGDQLARVLKENDDERGSGGSAGTGCAGLGGHRQNRPG